MLVVLAVVLWGWVGGMGWIGIMSMWIMRRSCNKVWRGFILCCLTFLLCLLGLLCAAEALGWPLGVAGVCRRVERVFRLCFTFVFIWFLLEVCFFAWF